MARWPGETFALTGSQTPDLTSPFSSYSQYGVYTRLEANTRGGQSPDQARPRLLERAEDTWSRHPAQAGTRWILGLLEVKPEQRKRKQVTRSPGAKSMTLVFLGLHGPHGSHQPHVAPQQEKVASANHDTLKA